MWGARPKEAATGLSGRVGERLRPFLPLISREEQSVVEQQDERAQPREDVEQDVLLRREAERQRRGSGVDVSRLAGRLCTEVEAEREHHERREQYVVAHEPRVVEDDGIHREEERERHHLGVAEMVAVQPRRERHQTGDERDRQSGHEVARAEQLEQDAVHLREKRAVNRRIVVPDTGLLIANRPVTDTGFVPVGEPGSETDTAGAPAPAP